MLCSEVLSNNRMNKNIKLSVVIPVYNEERSIAKVIDDHVRELRSLETLLDDWEIVCVDDASTDNSYALLLSAARANPRIRLLRHEKNQGIAESFGHLFRESRGTHIYLTAGDDQWPSENLPRLFHRLADSGSDLVVGVRQNRHEVYSPWRRLLSYGFNVIPKVLFRIDTEDANGIKLGRREIFVLPLTSRSFFAEIERLALARHKGYKITSAPIAFKHRPSGKARGAAWRNIWMTLRDMVRFFITPK
jgi:dolichol-phosphate mannosyltransferase